MASINPMVSSSRPTSLQRLRFPRLAALFLLTTALWSCPAPGRAQIYVQAGLSIGEYDASTGNAINATLISGYQGTGMALLGNTLFVSTNVSTVGAFNATTGQVSGTDVIMPFDGPEDILAAAGNTVYVVNNGHQEADSYNATTGALIPLTTFSVGLVPSQAVLSGTTLYTIGAGDSLVTETNLTTRATNQNFISGNLVHPFGIAIYGNDLFVSESDIGTVAEFDATSGVELNSHFITGLNDPLGLAVSGNNLFVVNGANGTSGAGTVAEYNAADGSPVNTSFITGLSNPGYIVAAPTPEPGSAALLILGAGLLGHGRWRRQAQY